MKFLAPPLAERILDLVILMQSAMPPMMHDTAESWSQYYAFTPIDVSSRSVRQKRFLSDRSAVDVIYRVMPLPNQRNLNHDLLLMEHTSVGDSEITARRRQSCHQRLFSYLSNCYKAQITTTSVTSACLRSHDGSFSRFWRP